MPALTSGGDEGGPVLGGSENLLLRGWRVAQDGGGVIMFLDNSPGSTLRVVPGMVLGPLGAVTDVQVGPEGAAVTFQSGDVLREDGVEPL